MAADCERLLSGVVRGGAALVAVLALTLPVAAECQHWLPGSVGRPGHPLLSGPDLQALFPESSQPEANPSASQPIEVPTIPLAPRPPGQCPAGIRCGQDSPAPPPKLVTPERLDAWACFHACGLELTTCLMLFDDGTSYCLLLSRRLERPPRRG